jgi:UDP:flavonoid glycosyltransferase YjiC (YdhE family)
MSIPRDEESDAERLLRISKILGDAMLPELLAASVERALRRVLNDEEMRRAFWEAGYRELERHAGANAARWLGERLWNMFVTAVVAASLAWMVVMSGRVK